MTGDIRDRNRIAAEDVLGLNFIRSPGAYLFRRHYRQGLRSHIMEILTPEEYESESRGVTSDGLSRFPRARPLKMLRIFRARFHCLEEALSEVRKVGVIAGYLGPGHLALSQEFLVDYLVCGRYELLLCGLQDYTEGEVLDPWGLLDRPHLENLFERMRNNDASGSIEHLLDLVRLSAEDFIFRLKKMLRETGYIPDLAGVGNLILTPSAEIKLVDINNVSRAVPGGDVGVDDRAYPVYDKSVQALYKLESGLTGRMDTGRFPYRTFLDPIRMEKVEVLEREFHLRQRSAGKA